MIPFIPNDEQNDCIKDIHLFIKEYKPFSKLLINGSAGTGKTTIIISTLVKQLIDQMKQTISIIKDAVETRQWEKIAYLNNYIITAPTNKAKDILVNKYNIYIEGLNNSDCIDATDATNATQELLNIFITILSKKITFLTVSQLLSISRVINEMGEEEFTKGNENKIADKYNKETYLTTSIIIDECSMIDTHTTKLLNVIKCPIIYIGDYCQLPPVNETLSTTFEIDKLPNTKSITLKKVERCKNNITLVANELRDKIYKTKASFNLLSYNDPNIIIYNKKFGSWVRAYVKDIKTKQKDLQLISKTIKNDTYLSNQDNQEIINQDDIKGQVFDTIALGWTNKCCMLLNEKIREHLFKEIENITTMYIIKGDKLLIKSPYYKYNNRIFSSSIVYVANETKITYKPLSFKEWCNIIVNMNDDDDSNSNSEKKTIQSKPIFDIDINSILDENIQITSSNTTKVKNPKHIDDYFKVEKSDTSEKNERSEKNEKSNNKISDTKSDTTIIEEAQELLLFRSLFYKHHQLSNRIATDNYIFTDELSLKYNLLIPKYDLHHISKMGSNFMRASIYTKWHKLMSIKLFGIPNETICCKKCLFFLNKFLKQIHTSTFINDFIDATHKLKFDMYLCDLVSFTSNGKNVYKHIPILNLQNETNNESIKSLRNIIKNSYEVKVMLSRNEERELNSINKMLNEESGDNEGSSKYITLSQLFGHYLSHVITSCYPEIDYGYALTIHKSQGSTYDDVYVEYANILTNMKENERNKLLYTAITRSAHKLHLFI